MKKLFLLFCVLIVHTFSGSNNTEMLPGEKMKEDFILFYQDDKVEIYHHKEVKVKKYYWERGLLK